MASETEIINLALVPLLGANSITNRTDESTEAITMDKSFDYCRDKVIEEAQPTFCTNRAIWTPTNETPLFNYGYSYLIPTTVIKVLGVNEHLRGYNWRREKDRILANDESIQIRYIEQETNTNFFSPGFNNALALYLAWFNCIALTQNRALKDSLWAQYLDALSDAMSSDNQQGQGIQTYSDALIRVR